jgi:cytochrome c peroxidase
MHHTRAARRHDYLPLVAVVLCAPCACAGAASTPDGTSATNAQDATDAAADAGGFTMPWAIEPFPPPVVPADNPPSAAKTELGRLLFHDPILSSDRTVACVTCHSQYWGMADGLPLAIGVGGVGPTGTGRTGPTHTRRNALTLWNAAYRSALFWDGRAASLEDQVLGPLESPVELDRQPDALVSDLMLVPEYVQRFHDAFPGDPDPVSLDNLRRAVASFVRTIVSTHAPYDQYVRGDPGAMSDTELRGMSLFGSYGCAECHTPPLFGKDIYANVAVPPVPGIADEGRFEVTGDPGDKGCFRVPTLRNLRASGPYFHTGAVTTIEDAVAWMAAHDGGTRAITTDEVSAIATFLRTSLTDTSQAPERPLTVPSGLPVPPDGFEIRR